MYDTLIKNGFVVDGTGAPGFIGDVAVKGDKIVKIAKEIEGEAEKVIDAKGKIVMPGLIDPHTHEEWVCFINGAYELFLREGVTTVVTGNCGHSVFPGPTERVMDYWYSNGLANAQQRDDYKKRFPKWEDFQEYARAVENTGTNINMATLIGHGCIRWSVMGGAFDRPPTEEESKEIERIIRRNLEQGAFGISFGLDYVPSRYANMEELCTVSKIVKEYDAMAAAHLRHYIGFEASTLEFLEVGKRTGVKLQVSHLTSSCPEAFEDVKAMAEAGGRVLVDTIPRSTGHCVSRSRLIQFIMSGSDYFFNAGADAVKEALKTKEGRELLMKESSMVRGSKADKFIIGSEDPSLEGRSIEDIAKERGQDPDDCMFDLIADDREFSFWLGGPRRKDFPGEHCDKIMANPYVCVGSDELKGDPERPNDWYELQRRGAFPIFMNMYLKKGVPIEEIIRRNTSMVARHFGFESRGELKEGYFADITVMDVDKYYFPGPEEIDYLKPLTMAEGVEYVLVNGEIALEAGELKRPYSGRVLKRK